MQYSESKQGFVVKLLGGGEKLVSQINSDDLKSIEQANRELSPKEIARAQLTAIESIGADVRAIMGSVQAPIAGSRLASSVAEVMRGFAAGGRGVVQEIVPTKTSREEFNKMTEGTISSINDLISGKGSISDVFDKISSINLDVYEKKIGSILEKIETIPTRPEFKQEIMGDNQVRELGTTISTAIGNSISGLFSSFGIESKGGTLNQKIIQENNVKVEDIKVDVNGEITLTGKNNEPINISPELKSFIENIVKSQLEMIYGKGQMNAIPAKVR